MTFINKTICWLEKHNFELNHTIIGLLVTILNDWDLKFKALDLYFGEY